MKDILDELPSSIEIVKAIDQLNNCKAAGMDGISPELLKSGGKRKKDLVSEVVKDVWVNITPKAWKGAILVSIFKKGAKSECGNYRGILLLPIVGKVFARILLNRLLEHITPSIIPESQCGFRANRGTVDMVFTAGQIQEKYIE